MQRFLNLYLDDSGTRHPNKSPQPGGSEPDWFAFGGFVVNEEDEDAAQELHDAFCRSYGITYPLHSWEMRHKAKNFRWLNLLSDLELAEFYRSLYHDYIRQVPFLGHATVVHRQNYLAKYAEMYNGQPWRLCKSAFAIVVERAARIATEHDRKLRVFVEMCSEAEDKRIRRYFDELRGKGMPFNPANSSRYAPMDQSDLAKILYEIQFKPKKSRLMQLADLVLYPIARGKYEPSYRPYQLLKRDGKLIDCSLPEEQIATRGIKYYCFVDVKSAEPASARELVLAK